MPVHNADIADALDELADLLEIQGGNAFRVRAYRNAGRTVRHHPETMHKLVEEGRDLSELPNIGKDLAQQIATLAADDTLPQLEELRGQVPEGLIAMRRIGGLGPKRVKALYDELGIASVDDLEKAAKAGDVQRLDGFGKKTEQSILEALQRRDGEAEKRTPRRRAVEVAEALRSHLEAVDGVKDVVVAGSYRRQKETVGDLDIVVTAKRGAKVMEAVKDYEDVREVSSAGETRASIVLRSGLQVDVRLVQQAAFGAAVLYFTGSKAHGVRLRRRAQERDLKLNEYGLFRGDDRIAGKSEAEVYGELDLPFIPPELREDRGEIEAAAGGNLPELVTLEAIRGNLHNHTDASDGTATLEEMAEAAKAKGWDYLAISDHSQAVRVANGLDEKRLSRQIDAIDDLNERLDGITLLKSCEVDILENGRLDLDDDVLERLDFAICAVHSRFELDQETQTTRILKAMEHPACRLLAHPTGRLLDRRPGYAVDVERLIAQAKETGCVLELNAQPKRLDLHDVHCRMAKEAGVKIAIGTDAHATAHLDFMADGIAQARRAWLTADDVVNTRPLKDLKRLLAPA